MISIEPSQVTPALKSLFDPGMPSGIRCFAVLEGGNNGKILTDNPERPRWGYVWEADDGTLYRGGAQEAKILAEVIDTLRQEGVVALGYRDGDPAVDLFPPDPNAGAACIEFDRPNGSSDLSLYWDRLPDGYEIRRIDRTLFQQCPTYEAHVVRYGGTDNFLEKALGVCIMRGDEVVCESYADIDIMGVREIGIFTQKAHRRQGLATVACASLIKLCEESGSQTYWDCARLNLASVAVARKLGFRNERAYKLLAWFPLQG